MNWALKFDVTPKQGLIFASIKYTLKFLSIMKSYPNNYHVLILLFLSIYIYVARIVYEIIS